ANFSLARRADMIIVPSMATRDDVVSLLSIPRERVVVIPLASDIDEGSLAAADEAVPAVATKLRLKGRYLLHTGGHDPVKNLPRLLDAFTRLVVGGRDLGLVIAGEHTRHTGLIIERAARLRVLQRVSLPGFVAREDLVALYRGAAALVYPSSAEGFGLPILEAMTCGTPVIAGRAGALPEVGGDACLYADPEDTSAIAEAVARVVDDPSLSGDLSRRGKARAAGFTWRQTARKTLAVYRGAAS
ncbi:MAG TPA: glycosyltransferase family 1 protein, partial [Candidatus Polarisedimenticolia bacterium]|nr:glycosyltransferase family 1 protein [Candidatus Polarisedimenticolia bacterium]